MDIAVRHVGRVGKACPELDEGQSVPTRVPRMLRLCVQGAFSVGTLRFAHPTGFASSHNFYQTQRDALCVQ